MTDDKTPEIAVVIDTGAGSIRMLAEMVGETNLSAIVADRVEVKPDIEGPHGRAWKVDMDAIRIKYNIAPENDGTVAAWIVEAPWAHPAWHSYVIYCVHLRPLPDNRRTLIYFPEATHEILLFALDPHHPRQPIIEGKDSPHRLTPSNFAAQFVEISDELAAERIEQCAREIVEGKLSPDTDFISQWIARFNDSMMKGRPNAREPEVRGGK